MAFSDVMQVVVGVIILVGIVLLIVGCCYYYWYRYRLGQNIESQRINSACESYGGIDQTAAADVASIESVSTVITVDQENVVHVDESGPIIIAANALHDEHEQADLAEHQPPPPHQSSSSGQRQYYVGPEGGVYYIAPSGSRVYDPDMHLEPTNYVGPIKIGPRGGIFHRGPGGNRIYHRLRNS